MKLLAVTTKWVVFYKVNVAQGVRDCICMRHFFPASIHLRSRFRRPLSQTQRSGCFCSDSDSRKSYSTSRPISNGLCFANNSVYRTRRLDYWLPYLHVQVRWFKYPSNTHNPIFQKAIKVKKKYEKRDNRVSAILGRLKLFRIENSECLNRSPPCRTTQFTGVYQIQKTPVACARAFNDFLVDSTAQKYNSNGIYTNDGFVDRNGMAQRDQMYFIIIKFSIFKRGFAEFLRLGKIDKTSNLILEYNIKIRILGDSIERWVIYILFPNCFHAFNPGVL